MASSKEYLGFVLNQLSSLDDITYKAMMGEYTFTLSPDFRAGKAGRIA